MIRNTLAIVDDRPATSSAHGTYWQRYTSTATARRARARLQTVAAAADDGGMLPEQVWDGRPPTGERGRRAGEGTLSATPLLWSHAQLVRLAWSIDAGRPVEQPAVVACRYAGCR